MERKAETKILTRETTDFGGKNCAEKLKRAKGY